MPPDQPPGYLFRDVSRSARAAVSRQSFANAVEITKAALQRHIKNYFDDGRFASFFSGLASSAQFTLSDINARDRLAVPLQLVRRFPDIKMRLPAVVINNTGFIPQRTSLANGIEGGLRTPDGTLVLTMTKLAIIPVELICAALDPTQAAELMEDVVLIFTTLQAMTQTAQIVGNPGDNWVVTLPGEVGAVDGPAEEPIPDSDESKDKLHTYTIAMNVVFESNVQTAVPFKPSFEAVREATTATALPDKIRLGQQVFAGVTHRPINTHYATDTPAVAVVDERGFVYARGLGKFRFLIVDDADPTNVRFSKEIHVVSSL